MNAQAPTLAGKTIFITGASRGIGLAMAERFARDGANLILTGKTLTAHDSLPGSLEATAERVRAVGGQALALVIGPVAVRRPDDVAKLVLAQVLEAHAGQFAKALVGPEYLAVGAGTHNARRRMAQHMCGLLRCGGAKVVGSAGAPQQPPSQRASDQHIKRIFDRTVARQQVG